MADTESWKPFRPTASDLEALTNDVSEIGEIQKKLVDRHKDLQQPDRVAHQYQIAGGKVILRIADSLPEELQGVGLFEEKAEHMGIGRVSTGLGCPHAEPDLDFLGLMLAFQTRGGRRVDFLTINDPASPADDHREFMDILHATGEAAGSQNFFSDKGRVLGGLLERRGPKGALTFARISTQTSRTSLSSTAYQAYWTSIVETGPTAAKFTLVPVVDENKHTVPSSGRRFTEDWKSRQAKGDVVFHLFWIPFLNEKDTPTDRMAKAWEQDHKQLVGTVTFPQADLASPEARLWATLAAEMGANQGNWVANKENSIPEPATAFGAARKIAYRKSQEGRGALDPKLYEVVFKTGTIDPVLEAELRRRRQAKETAGHVSAAPV